MNSEPDNINSEWTFVDSYGAGNYSCGLEPGDRIMLREDMEVTDHRGNLEEIIAAGLPWTVLTKSKSDSGIIWLREPNGRRHTWDDTDKIFQTFERVP